MTCAIQPQVNLVPRGRDPFGYHPEIETSERNLRVSQHWLQHAHNQTGTSIFFSLGSDRLGVAYFGSTNQDVAGLLPL